MASIKEKNWRKNLDIPVSTVKVLAKLATDARMPVKNYMEKVLIEFARNNNPNNKVS